MGRYDYMSRLNRECLICHARYKFCPSCSEDAKKPLWMALFCSDNCHEIYTTLTDYRDGKLTKQEAFDKLKTLDTSCSDKFVAGTKTAYEKIVREENEDIVEVMLKESDKDISNENIFNEEVIDEVIIDENKETVVTPVEINIPTEETTEVKIESSIKRPKNKKKGYIE